LCPEEVGVFDRGEIAPAGHRIELHGVKIRRHDRVTGRAQGLLRRLEQSAVRALRLSVGVSDESFQAREVEG